jgi:hypothetical protein
LVIFFKLNNFQAVHAHRQQVFGKVKDLGLDKENYQYFGGRPNNFGGRPNNFGGHLMCDALRNLDGHRICDTLRNFAGYVRLISIWYSSSVTSMAVETK